MKILLQVLYVVILQEIYSLVSLTLNDWLVDGEFTEEYKQMAFKRLIIVCPPHILGMFRKSLPKVLGKLVTAEVEKDLIHLSPQDIFSHLEDIFFTPKPVIDPLSLPK